MKRRNFCSGTGCALAGMLAAPALLGADPQEKAAANQPPKERKYKFEIEIFEARADSWCHKKGDKFKYPEEMGKICNGLLGSMHDFLVALQYGATLPWKYENTPYQKVIDPDGVTTEYIRCPDPTSNLVAKITRTLI